ncbi:MAG: alpha/beta hydrolase [Bacteroidales bacterium]|nr:alpha/beta hydrolase [Bacteroidales bacterium]
MKKLLIGLILLIGATAQAQTDERKPQGVSSSEVYRNNPDLKLYFYYPDSKIDTANYPALMLFFGGGWRTGAPKAFEHHADYFKKRGLVVILADYRTSSVFGTPPEEAVKDAKSAMRYIRVNAKRLHINSDMIAAGGGSAGGHLAAACATIDEYNNSSDDTTISANPNALILFNPVINNGPDNYGFERVGAYYLKFSPYYNLRKGVPPTVIMQGTSDNLIPVKTIELYKQKMDSLGIRCDLHFYEGQKHGFFNISNKEYYDKTMQVVDDFLVSLNYIKK